MSRCTQVRARSTNFFRNRAAMIEPARPWWPGAGPPPAPSPEVLTLYLQQILAANRMGLSAWVSVPGVRRIMELAGGHLFLLELVLASAGLTRLDPVAFSRRGFAARYGVSRPHATDLTAEAERLGWLIRAGDGVRLTPEFADEARRWCAIHFVLCNATLEGRLVPAMQAAGMANSPAG